MKRTFEFPRQPHSVAKKRDGHTDISYNCKCMYVLCLEITSSTSPNWFTLVLPRDAMFAVVVRLYVCHKPALFRNDPRDRAGL